MFEDLNVEYCAGLCEKSVHTTRVQFTGRVPWRLLSTAQSLRHRKAQMLYTCKCTTE